MNDLRQRAIALLARRDHSRAELARKLSAHGTDEEIAALVAELESAGLLSDVRAAAAYLRSHGERFGAARLRHELQRRGIDPDSAVAEIEELPDELARARAVWARKFGNEPADAREWARQARFLQSRGFAADVIRRLLKSPDS